MNQKLKIVDNAILGWDRFLVKVLKKYAKKHNLKIVLFSGDWIIELENSNKKRFFIFGLDLGLNSSSTKLLVRDKVGLYNVLKYHKIPILEHKLFLKPGSLGTKKEGQWGEMIKFFKKNKQSIVCKPNAGGGGIDIFLAQNQNELEKSVTELFKKYRAIAFSPYVKIENEYRITVLDDEVLLVYKKVKKENDFQFNLSKGAFGKVVKDKKVLEELSYLALKATKTIGLRLANVDVISVNGKFMIMEINSGLMFEHFVKQGEKEKQIAEKIYEKILDKLILS